MKTLKEKHKQYTTDFKLTAVHLAEHPDIQTQDVALALGIHPFMLSRWKKECRDGKLKGPVHESIQDMEDKVLEQKQVRALEKRVKQLELENALLKKSIHNSSEQN
jgi:transposase